MTKGNTHLLSDRTIIESIALAPLFQNNGAYAVSSVFSTTTFPSSCLRNDQTLTNLSNNGQNFCGTSRCEPSSGWSKSTKFEQLELCGQLSHVYHLPKTFHNKSFHLDPWTATCTSFTERRTHPHMRLREPILKPEKDAKAVNCPAL